MTSRDAIPATAKSGRDAFARFEGVIRCVRRMVGVLPPPVAALLLAVPARVPGKIGAAARFLRWGRVLRGLGLATYLARSIVLKHPARVSIGDFCSIHEFCYLDGFGGIEIGDAVSIAHGCSILSSNHGWDDPDRPIKYNDVTPGPVVIEDDVWIGCGVRILAGVTIERRTVVAAGAVVTRDLPGGFLYAGVPARKVRAL